MRKQIKYLSDLFELAGNAGLFAGKLNIHQFTAERWSTQGIPKKYHKLIEDNFNISRAEIEWLDKDLRNKANARKASKVF